MFARKKWRYKTEKSRESAKDLINANHQKSIGQFEDLNNL
jgi:hypothetical protein